MMDAGARKKVLAHRVLSAVLGLLSMVGWSLYAYSVSSSAARERALRAQVASISNDRMQLVAEQYRLRAIAEQQAQVRTTQPMRADDGPAHAAATGDAPSPTQSPSSGQPSVDEVGETGSVSSRDDVRESVRTAQLALTHLGYGSLKADGVMGRSTRRALEAFERMNGLAVTGELGPRTVQALKGAAQGTLN
jgi:hypothetical protein